MSLRLKANLLFVGGSIALVLLVLLAITGAARTDAVDQARRQAELLTSEAAVASRYTAEKVAPLLGDNGRGQLVFVPAAAPFYAAQTQTRMLEDANPGSSVRQLVLDPVGTADRPSDDERKIIETLHDSDHPAAFTREQAGADGPQLSLITPLLFSPGICATCYSSRSAAPAGILDAFGGNGGFDRKPGEVVGITIATVPLPVLHAGRTALVWLVVLVVALIGLFNLLLELLVLRPLGRVASVAERVSLGQTGVEEFATAGNDEIGTITRSFNRLRRSMESAIGLIES